MMIEELSAGSCSLSSIIIAFHVVIYKVGGIRVFGKSQGLGIDKFLKFKGGEEMLIGI